MGVHPVKDQADFDDQLDKAGSKLIVVDFYATWCGPCKMISPKVETMSEEFGDVVFLKVDVDECEDIASKYEINAMPTFVFIRNGQKIESFSGANAEKLQELIKKL